MIVKEFKVLVTTHVAERRVVEFSVVENDLPLLKIELIDPSSADLSRALDDIGAKVRDLGRLGLSAEGVL